MTASDERPPRFAGDERETVMALWRYHRDSFFKKLDGLSDEQAATRIVPTETTLLWLADHMAMTQLGWLVDRFLGEPPATDRHRPPSVTVAEAVEYLRTAWERVDAIIDDHDFDDLCAVPVHGDTDLLNLRWVVVHLLEETARHAGHADIIRELIDGSTGR